MPDSEPNGGARTAEFGALTAILIRPEIEDGANTRIETEFCNNAVLRCSSREGLIRLNRPESQLRLVSSDNAYGIVRDDHSLVPDYRVRLQG